MPGGFWHLVCCNAYGGLYQEESTAIFHLPWEKNKRKSLTWNENTNLQSCRQSLCPRMPNAFKYKSSSLADGKPARSKSLTRNLSWTKYKCSGITISVLKLFFFHNQGLAFSHAVLLNFSQYRDLAFSHKMFHNIWVEINR